MVLVLPEVEMACKVLLVARFNAARDRSSWAGIPNVVGDPLVTHAKATVLFVVTVRGKRCVGHIMQDCMMYHDHCCQFEFVNAEVSIWVVGSNPALMSSTDCPTKLKVRSS
jgi:hypothetical protein